MNQMKNHSGLLLLFLLLCVTLLCCRVPAAQADDMPWAGSGTEEDGDADFAQPWDTAEIEEDAFENNISITAVDAGGCGILGAGAFRGCTGLTKIRLPKDCIFGEGVFDGCTSLTVLYGEGGGTAQEWAEAHGLLFADETPADPVIIVETESSE